MFNDGDQAMIAPRVKTAINDCLTNKEYVPPDANGMSRSSSFSNATSQGASKRVHQYKRDRVTRQGSIAAAIDVRTCTCAF